MTLNHIKIFIKVYQEENITKAAKLLNMTQPAVSRAIREIENYYNIVLFERMNRRLKITESGRKLYSQAIHISNLFDNMEENLKSMDEAGSIKIGASITLGSYLLPRLIASFTEKYPQISVNVLISNSENLHNALKHNEIDIALIEGEVMDNDLSSMFLVSDQLVLTVSENHPLTKLEKITMKDLSKYKFLSREKGSVTRLFVDNAFSNHGLKIDQVWESSCPQAIINAVHFEIGITLLPEHLVRYYAESGHVKTKAVSDEEFIRKNYIVWHKNKMISKAINRFMRECISFITEHPDIYS